MLIEPSATNVIYDSSSFTTSGTSVKTTGFEAPDGTNTATKISNMQDATGTRAYSQVTGVSGSTAYVGSIYLKGTAGETVRIEGRRQAGATFSSSGTQEIICDGTWQRITNLAWTTAADNTAAFILIKNESGTTADEVYLWGAQLEAGSVSTSVIPTSGSTVTRAADNLSITGSAFSDFYNTSEGTFYVEGVDRQATGSAHSYIVGQSTSQFFMYKNTGSTLIASYDGTNILSLGPIVDNQLFRAAVSYKTSGSVKSLSFNGTSGVDQPYSGNFAATNILKIGNGYTDVFSGHFRRIIYWPTHSDSL